MDYAPMAFSMATPIRKWYNNRLLGLAMGLARHFREYAPLARIGTIHVAGFSFVYALADRHGEKRRLKYPFLMFLSLFDGGFTQYVADFGSVIPDQVDDIWNKCTRYPGARNAGPFTRWLNSHQFTHNGVERSYSYFGYGVNGDSGAPPDDSSSNPTAGRLATVPLVLNAVDLRDRLRRLRDTLVARAETTPAEVLFEVKQIVAGAYRTKGRRR